MEREKGSYIKGEMTLGSDEGRSTTYMEYMNKKKVRF